MCRRAFEHGGGDGIFRVKFYEVQVLNNCNFKVWVLLLKLDVRHVKSAGNFVHYFAPFAQQNSVKVSKNGGKQGETKVNSKSNNFSTYEQSAPSNQLGNCTQREQK